MGVREMTQWLRMLPTLTENPSLAPSIHTEWLTTSVTPAPGDIVSETPVNTSTSGTQAHINESK